MWSSSRVISRGKIFSTPSTTSRVSRTVVRLSSQRKVSKMCAIVSSMRPLAM